MYYLVRCGHCRRIAEASMGCCPFCGYDGIEPKSEGMNLAPAPAADPERMRKAVHAMARAIHNTFCDCAPPHDTCPVDPKPLDAANEAYEAASPFFGGLPPSELSAREEK